MKKMMMIAAMMVATISASAQFEPGTWSVQPKLGGTVSKVSNMPSLNIGREYGSNVSIDRSFHGGGLVGAELEYQFTNMFSVAAGVNYAMQGCQWEDYKVVGGKSTVNVKDLRIDMDYINIPVVLNAYLFKGFAVKAGVQFGFLTRAKVKGNEEKTIDNVKTTTDYEMDVKDGFKTFDLAIPVGISYQVPTVPIYIDARYNIGLTDTAKNNDLGKSVKNQVFQLTVGYKFDL